MSDELDERKGFGPRSRLVGSLLRHDRILAIFPVEQITHGFSACGVRAPVGFQRVRGFFRVCRLSFAAVGTAVGEAGLAGLEFELFAADYAGFDGIGHVSMIQGRIRNAQAGEPAPGFANGFIRQHDSFAEIGIVSAIARGC